MECTIETAGVGDVPIVHEIMREIEAALSRREFFVGNDRECLERHIDREGFILLARFGDECAGFLMTDIPGEAEMNLGRDLGWPPERLPRCAHIDSVCVRPVWRGRGLQKLLTREAEDRLLRMGMEWALATVHPENAASLSSLLALGYGIGATMPKYGGLPRHILFKRLRRSEGPICKTSASIGKTL